MIKKMKQIKVLNKKGVTSNKVINNERVNYSSKEDNQAISNQLITNLM